MPRYKMFRRRYVSKRKPGLRKRRIYRRRAGRPTRNPKHGGMFLRRKVDLIRIFGSGVAGTLTVPAQNTLIVGTPIPVAGLTNIYDVPFSIQARLDELVQSTELTTLFDQYKITHLKVKLQTTLSTGTQNSTVIPYLEYRIDNDDSTPPTISMMRQSMGAKIKYFNATRPFVVMACKPRAQYQLFDGTVSGLAPAFRPTWIDCNNASQAHYGIKGILRNVAIGASAGTSPFSFDVELGVALKDVQ